ncbi:hypothetical protein [uncultured Acinetobacter sp.]|uniref:hypothetical protein n=1 Tax=uncultured Acinetobacter sp. TaxID=165433 RepID=UPI00258D62C1|nr:hypothetical protein [uncultured Acinetobacter sp.]
MTLKDSVQTAILIVGFFSLLVFGASYYFVLIDPDSSSYPLKESLSITASFFGGFATLTAAYIASRLFNDWKDQTRFEINKEIVSQIIQTSAKIYYSLNRFQVSVAHTKDAENALVLTHHLINIENYQCYNDISKLYEYVDTNCVLNSNTEIKDKLGELKYYLMNLESLIKNYWLHIYKPYYDKAISEDLNHKVFEIYERQYKFGEEVKYRSDINNIINFFKNHHTVGRYNNNNKLIQDSYTYDQLSDEYERVYDEFIELVVSKLKI